MNAQPIERAHKGQFGKGKSANSNGRPKGSKNKPDLISQIIAELGDFSDLEFSLDSIRDGQLVLARRLRYSVHGDQTLFAYVAFRLVALALAGNLEAIRIILDRTEGRVPPPLNPAGSGGGNPLTVVVIPPEEVASVFSQERLDRN